MANTNQLLARVGRGEEVVKHFKNLLFSILMALMAIVIVPFGTVRAADEYGNFERILEASGSFDDTVAALENALKGSSLSFEGKTDLNYLDAKQRAKTYVVTSGAWSEATKDEPANTISAKVIRIGVYEYGKGKPTHINMLNPEAGAMIFYAGSKNYDNIIKASRAFAQEIRDVVAKVPGKTVSVQLEPIRSEKSLNKYNGDGPAKMMAKFRNWKESQNEAFSVPGTDIDAVATMVRDALKATADKGFDDSAGWRIVNETKIGNAVQFGVINDYTSNKCIRINSDFRSEGKSDDAPFPGVDHAPGLPLEIIVYTDGKKTYVVHYGLMWFFQRGWWDSGYMAFAKNTLIPSILFSSINSVLEKAAPKMASK